MPDASFFQSNLFLAIITIVVGLFAFILYKMRNADSKRRIARIIFLEITNAETQLRDARNRLEDSGKNGNKTLPEGLYVMPLDTWSSNRHLFVNDFKTTEWESLNEFYSKCQAFDAAIKNNDSRFSKDEQQIRKSVHKATYHFAKEMFDTLRDDMTPAEKSDLEDEFFTKRNQMARFLTTGENLWLYTPSKDMRDVESILTSVNYNLSTSSVGVKLSKLARRRINLNMHKQ